MSKPVIDFITGHRKSIDQFAVWNIIVILKTILLFASIDHFVH